MSTIWAPQDTPIRSSKSVLVQGLCRSVLTALLALSLAACGALDFFSSDTSEQPTELQDFSEEVRFNQKWSVSVGDGQGDRHNKLTPALDGANIYAASADGTVMAIDKANGRVLWRVRTEQIITGGVGASNGLVLFGTRNARVVALEQSTGQELWNIGVSSEVLAAPQTDGRIVVAQTVDGKLMAFEAASGERRWIYESTVPALTLRGSGRPLLAGNTVVAGFSNGMIAAIDASNGFLLWEERVAVPQGRYDIERVIDVDGDLLLSGSTVFASSYQGNLMGFDLQTGRIIWGKEGSSYHGLETGFGNIYVISDSSHVIAIRNNTDQIAWENEQLRLRQLTAPRTFGNYIAVGDFEGYVHLISQIDGRFVGRTKADGKGIRANLLADSDTLYVFGNSGKLSALSLR